MLLKVQTLWENNAYLYYSHEGKIGHISANTGLRVLWFTFALQRFRDPL